jgi:hypothetical protein
MASPPIGTCRLCLGANKVLRRSHILSKWKYRRARGGRSNPNPVKVTDGIAVQTSNQITEFLLCADCEQRFGVDEDYASRVAYQEDGSAPIFDHVLRLGEVEADGAEPGAVPAYPTTLDCESLLRFGASVLWRSHISVDVPSCSLRADHAEAFRLYLLGQGRFPTDAACPLVFIEDAAGQGSPIDLSFTTPATTEHDGFDTHRLLVCGLQFEFATGPRIPRAYRRLCFAGSDPRFLLVSGSDLVLDWLGPMFLGAKRSGALARSKQTQ